MERRLRKVLDVLEKGGAFMRAALKQKGLLLSDADIEREIYLPIDSHTDDIDLLLTPSSSW